VALDLSFQLGTFLDLADVGRCHNIFAPRSSKPGNSSQSSRRSVQFCETVDVLFGTEDVLTMYTTSVTHDSLCDARAKPWGWFHCPDVWSYDNVDDCYRTLRLNRNALDPLSSQAVLIRHLPPYNMLRLSDAWHQPIPHDMRGPDEQPAEEDMNHIPGPVRAPQFVRDLYDLAEQHRIFNQFDGAGILRVRTWYLHHHDDRRCLHPRILEYDEDWRHWEIDLGSAWRTHIRPNEEIQIHVAMPDPYRSYMSRPAHADLIISQGHWLPHFSTIITVHRTSRGHAPLSYALACSLERRVSGVRLADEADVLTACNQARTRCSVSYGWNRIPFTLRPTHDVFAGHAFVIQVSDQEPLGDSAHIPSPPPQPDVCRDRDSPHSHDFDMHDGDHGDEADPHNDPVASPSESSLHSDDLSVLVYRLSAPDAHGFTQGNSYMAILNAAMRACRLPRRLVRGYHRLLTSPVDILPEQEIAVILQTVDDIAPGSEEKLVLVDIEIHFHPLHDGLVVPAASSRRVLKVIPHLHRDQLLLLLGLRDYCQLEHDRCIVHCNHQLWPATDRRVVNIHHGTYLRVRVPPPLDNTLDTEVAIGIAREFGGDALPTVHCNSVRENSLSLRQTRAITQSFSQPTCHKTDPNQGEDLAPSQPEPPRIRRAAAAPISLNRLGPGVQNQLEALLHQADLIECEEEGRIMYVTTWYIHHRRAPRCYEGRPARLTTDVADWVDRILEPWIEVIDDTLAATIRIVRSTPPCNRWECVQAHLIIEQDSFPRQVVCLISHFDWRYSEQGWAHRALSTDNFQNVRSLLRAAELHSLCLRTTCSVHARGLPFAMVDFEEIGNAWGFVIYIARPPVADYPSDVNSLMQNAPTSHGLEFPPHAGEGGCFDFDPLAPAFIPNRADIWGLPEDIHDLHDVWRTGAQASATDTPVAHFLVWFLCPGGGMRRCLRPRRVTLSDDFTEWRERLTFAWREHIFETVPVEIHVITPRPDPLEQGITAHILLTQLIPDHESCVLLGISDNAINDAQVFRVALTVQDPANMHTFLGVAGYLFEQAAFALQYHHMPIAPGQLTPTRTGNYFALQVHRNMLPAHWTPPITPDAPGTEGLGLLQTKATLMKTVSCERLTHGLVAHTHGPQVEQVGLPDPPSSPVTLLLDETLTTAIEIVSGAHGVLPSFLEVPLAFEDWHIEQELRIFGHDCKAYLFGSHRKAFCIPREHQLPQPCWHVLFANVDPSVATGTFVHTFSNKWDEIQLMKVLHQLGFEKAFVLTIEPQDTAFTLVIFGESHGSIAQDVKPRLSRPWPPRQQRLPPDELFKPAATWTPDCLLNLGLVDGDLHNFFKPQVDVLCTSFEGIELPTVTVNALAALDTPCGLEAVDRLIIYVDGSSQPNQKHLPPLRVDAEGIPDAWAFLVLGETYVTEEHSTLHLLGWQAQQVRYDPESPNFAGALKVNSHIAEREGLFFAALWRAKLNCNLPTVFRSDSKLTCGQATGSIGAAEIDFSYSLLRGIFQFLETAIPPDALIVEHIYGHNDDPWNEAVDTLAKKEAQSSHFLPRIDADLGKWGVVIPFLWMIVGERYGCPQFCGGGFDVHAPDQPPCETLGDQLTCSGSQCDSTMASSISTIDFRISFASGNVSTLGVGARGLSGKLDYIKDQFKCFHLNFLGVQEARTKEGTLCSQGILRLCSGADSKNLGVELWCNLAQPFAVCKNQQHFFQANDFVVLHRDPRRLLIVVQNVLWHAYIFVGHAPHSGYALAERTDWWENTAAIVALHNAEQRPLFVLIDANASPGPCDHHVVLGPGHSASNSTMLWRQFLVDHELCLPATSALHVGPRYTWTAPDGIDKHFIDFVAIPQKLLSSCTWTQTLEQFDLNPLHEDHLAVGLEIAWQAVVQDTTTCPFARAWSCNRNAIAQASLAVPLSAPQDLQWHTNIEQHVESLNCLFREELTRQCKTLPSKPKKAFLSDELWQLRKRKFQLRRRLRSTQRTTMLENVARLFQCWRSQTCGHTEHLLALVDGSLRYEVSLRCSEVLRAAELWATCRTLKHKLSSAKKEVLAVKIAELTHLNSASEILCTLKPFVGSSNALKKGPRPLPLVHNDNGQPCRSAVEALDRWISFFMCMEGGSRVEMQHQRALWINNLQELAVDKLDVEVQEVPSLVDLEMAFRRVKKGKASGPDFLPSELFHYFPAVTAKHCYATLLKAALQGQECLLHKGGTLVPLWKGKGDKSLCSSFRSILLSSHFGNHYTELSA